MEINDFKPKEPADTPGTESPTAVKEALVEEAPVEEETLDGQTISPSELAESLVELKDRAKAAGIRPVQNMVLSYLNQGLAMVDGLLGSLEGKNKKDK